MKRKKSNKSYIAKLRLEVRLLRKETAGIEKKLKREIDANLNSVMEESRDVILFLKEEFTKLENEFEKKTGFRKDRFLKRLFDKIFKRR